MQLHIRIDAATNSHEDLATLSHFKLATSSKVLVVRCNQWLYPPWTRVMTDSVRPETVGRKCLLNSWWSMLEAPNKTFGRNILQLWSTGIRYWYVINARTRRQTTQSGEIKCRLRWFAKIDYSQRIHLVRHVDEFVQSPCFATYPVDGK